jgi:transcriptional regulator with XRE-family HTH domain
MIDMTVQACARRADARDLCVDLSVNTPYPADVFGERLHELRQRKKLSMRALAEKVEVDFSYISQIEHGKKQPSKDLIIRLARALRANEDELLIAAGHLPADVGEILGRDPRRSLLYIREKLARYGGK